MITEAVVSVPFQPTRWRGLKIARFSRTLLPVLNQPVLLVLLQPVLHVVSVLHVLQIAMGAVLLPSLAPKEQRRPLPEQEQHLLSEQVPELVTDGQEPEAPHRVMPMLKTVLLLVVTTPHALPQRVERALRGHAPTVQQAHAIARLVELGQERSTTQEADQQLRLQTEPILTPTTVSLSRVVGFTVVKTETRFTTNHNMAMRHALVLI